MDDDRRPPPDGLLLLALVVVAWMLVLWPWHRQIVEALFTVK